MYTTSRQHKTDEISTEEIKVMKSKITCTRCNGKKIIEGNCECNMEWRSSGDNDYWDDCKCDPDQECPECKGTGFIE